MVLIKRVTTKYRYRSHKNKFAKSKCCNPVDVPLEEVLEATDTLDSLRSRDLCGIVIQTKLNFEEVSFISMVTLGCVDVPKV